MEAIIVLLTSLLYATIDLVRLSIAAYPGVVVLIVLVFIAGLLGQHGWHKIQLRRLMRVHVDRLRDQDAMHRAVVSRLEKLEYEKTPEGAQEKIDSLNGLIKTIETRLAFLGGMAITPTEIPKGIVLRLLQEIRVGHEQYWLAQEMSCPSRLRLLRGLQRGEVGWLIDSQPGSFAEPPPRVRLGSFASEADEPELPILEVSAEEGPPH